ncbi:MAG: hypothetical protein F6K09_34955 [Merismopedia sp. SIO2A8]|nr:hypothetical protein [Symploca sp. SIO2B6]NET53660.1 hypothetical protein [Merismopedia sp. SIO2A8]
MSHKYEVFVDICEFDTPSSSHSHLHSARYEIDAESKFTANTTARGRATTDYPQATEYDVRVTRILT